MRTPTHIRRFNLGSERGQSMVEFAVILPILVMLFLAIWQFGVAFHHYLAITDAARVGARRLPSSGRAIRAAPREQPSRTPSPRRSGRISSRITCSAGANTGDPVTRIGITYPYTLKVFRPVDHDGHDREERLDECAPRHVRRESGQAMVFLVFALAGFVGMAALVIDGGSWLRSQRQLQTAADAGSSRRRTGLAVEPDRSPFERDRPTRNRTTPRPLRRTSRFRPPARSTSLRTRPPWLFSDLRCGLRRSGRPSARRAGVDAPLKP